MSKVDAINISTSGGFHRWLPACWILARGPDAESFLQGQFTNDLKLLERQPAVYGLWLSVKGKVVADSFILRAAAPESFWIGSYASPAETIRSRLESHIVADDLALEDFTREWAGLSLLGELAGRRPIPDDSEFVVFPGRRSRARSIECVGPKASIAKACEALAGQPEFDAGALERIRIADGLPAIPADIGPADLPNEGGLEAEAISYSKGCYLGQEVMARLKSMGQVRRRLRRVRGRGIAAAPGAPLYVRGRQVGELRSTARDGAEGFVGLAMLSLLRVESDSELSLAPDAPASVWLSDPT